MFELKQFPNKESIIVKEKYKERYSKLTDWDTYIKYSLSFLNKSIRVNTLKTDVKSLIKRLEDRFFIKQVPWCNEGFWIEHKKGRLDVGNTVEHALGYYYVQEAASMIPPIVLDPKENDIVLDMCAAPGSKTTQLASLMKNTGLIIANDLKGDRLAALGINVQKSGITNTIINLSHGEAMRDVLFDKILLDAPCSGTGTIRKSVKTLLIWNPLMFTRLKKTQLNLLKSAWKMLKPEGTLVYSTCSLEPEENEEVISTFLDENTDARIEKINIHIKRSPAILEFDGKKYNKKVKDCLRIWPQDNDTEGFFVCKLSR